MRRTKIICTIGPKIQKYQYILDLAKLGMNIARLNMSHSDHRFHKETIESVRRVNSKGFNVATMLDTKGAEIRTGDLKKDLDIKRGEKFVFTIRPTYEGKVKGTTLTYDLYIDEVKKEDVILVDGGILSFKVEDKTKTDIITEALDNGRLTSRRHVNTKGKSAKLPTITEYDWKDIDWGIEEKVNFIALSFVKDAKAIKELKKYLLQHKAKISVIAKIESAEAIPHIDEIIEAADGIMVARGDLGSELPPEEVPLLQEEMVEKCLRVGKPVIIATHLLESMIHNPTPTRAEVADIAHAVGQKADALMLSAETAIGLHPFKSIIVMDAVARRIERKISEGNKVSIPQSDNSKIEMVRSASIMANNISAHGIIVFTRSGYTAQLSSWCRPNSPVFAFSQNTDVCRKLSLYWGVEAYFLDFKKNPEQTVRRAMAIVKKNGYIKKGDKIVLVSDILVGGKKVETIQIRMVE